MTPIQQAALRQYFDLTEPLLKKFVWTADKAGEVVATTNAARAALASLEAAKQEPLTIPKERLALNVRHRDCHKAADAFWDYWRANGETHKHGYYESTWGAINQALRTVGVVEHPVRAAMFDAIEKAKGAAAPSPGSGT